jgi:hypothetical protein
MWAGSSQLIGAAACLTSQVLAMLWQAVATVATQKSLA